MGLVNLSKVLQRFDFSVPAFFHWRSVPCTKFSKRGKRGAAVEATAAAAARCSSHNYAAIWVPPKTTCVFFKSLIDSATPNILASCLFNFYCLMGCRFVVYCFTFAIVYTQTFWNKLERNLLDNSFILTFFLLN